MILTVNQLLCLILKKPEPNNNQEQTSVSTQRTIVSAEQEPNLKLIPKGCHIKSNVSITNTKVNTTPINTNKGVKTQMNKSV